MEIVTAIVVGLLAGVGARLLLCRNLFRILLGLALAAQGANVLLFTAAGLRQEGGSTPVVAAGAEALPEGHPDPLVQALVLTAIVISFGVLAFCLTLLKKAYSRSGRSDISFLSMADSDS